MASASGPQTAAKYCENCGQVNPRSAALCSRCGGTTFRDAPPEEGRTQIVREERQEQVVGAFRTVVRVAGVLVALVLLAIGYPALWFISPLWKLVGWAVVVGVYFFLLEPHVVLLVHRLVRRVS